MGNGHSVPVLADTCVQADALELQTTKVKALKQDLQQQQQQQQQQGTGQERLQSQLAQEATALSSMQACCPTWASHHRQPSACWQDCLRQRPDATHVSMRPAARAPVTCILRMLCASHQRPVQQGRQAGGGERSFQPCHADVVAALRCALCRSSWDL